MDEDKYTDKQVCDILSNNHFSNLLQYVLHMFGTMPRSMTEEEIVQYLKMNKNIGIVFKFMPEEVKEWCRKYSKKLYWYDMDILVDRWSNGGFEKRLCDDKVYTLSEDFQIKKEQKGEWVEFEIEDSCFAYSHTVGTSHLFDWFDWGFFLKSGKKQGWGFTAFGGWQYADSNTWFMTPRLKVIIANSISYKDNDALVDCYTTPSAVECRPAIPVKIRFWKGE